MCNELYNYCDWSVAPRKTWKANFLHIYCTADVAVPKTRFVGFDPTTYNSRRPSIDFSMVISSAYSMSLPTGMPIAIRVTRSPALRSCPER